MKKDINSNFNINVLTLLTGTTIAQAIPIAISPILTRIFTPEDFGIFALFAAIAAIFGVISNGRYELAIMLPDNEEDAINIAALALLISFAVSGFLLIVIIFFNFFFSEFFLNQEILLWLYFVPLSVFLMGLWNILNYFNTRNKKYKNIANATILKSIILALAQIGFGFLKSGAFALIIGQLLSQFFGNTKLFLNIIKDKALLSKISKSNMLFLSKKYKDFPKYNAPAALADTFTFKLPPLMLPKIFGLVISGYFFLAQRIVSIPSALIGKSISQVFFQEISEKKSANLKVWPIYVDTIKKLTIIGLPCTILIYISSPLLFEIIFGDQWRISGEIARYLSIVFFFSLISSSVSSVFSVSGFIKRGAFWKYLYLFTSLIIFFIALIFKIEFLTFLIFYTIHEILLYLVYLILITKTVIEMDSRINT